MGYKRVHVVINHRPGKKVPLDIAESVVIKPGWFGRRRASIFLGIVNSGLISLGVDPFYTNVVKGGALLISVMIEQLTQERNERHRKAMAIADWSQQMAERQAATDKVIRRTVTDASK